MHKRPCSVLILSSALVVAVGFSPRGQTTPPPDRTRSEVTMDDVETCLYSCLKENGEIKDSRLSFEIYVQKIQGRKLIAPVLKHRNSDGDIDYVAQARDGELTVLREKGRLRIHLSQGKMSGADGSRCSFEERDVLFDLPKDFGPK